MNPSGQDGRTLAGTGHPGPMALASFFVRSKALQTGRLVKNMVTRGHPLQQGIEAEFPFVIAESVSALRTNPDSRERPLQLGKIHNLRLACQKVHRRVLMPGQIFSFWRQIGAPWRLRGFARGREVREGCVIPTTGGGLCQLSGALLEVASSAGCQLVERHRHTALPADVPYNPCRDATIFWNYVDLRFLTPAPILFECHLTSDALVVRVRGKSPRAAATHMELASTQRTPLQIRASCYTCFKRDCLRQCDPVAQENSELGKTAFLMDEPHPEFEAYVDGLVRSGDQLLMQSPSWNIGSRLEQQAFQKRSFPLLHLRRAWKLRATVSRGGTVAKTHFESAALLAKAYCKHVAYNVEHLYVAQTLLPYLWESGFLGGRSFDVLMYRLPVKALERELDQAAGLYPQCTTLREFRAPEWFAEAEGQALNAARRIVTPHAQIAALFGNSLRLPWQKPAGENPPGRDAEDKDLIVFLGPTLARKGAYAVREIVRRMGFELTIVGSELEGPDFWQGLRVRRASLASLPWNRIHTVLQPSLFEFWPRQLLRAHAAGSRLVISPGCGIEEDHQSGIYHVPFGDTESAINIMETLLANQGVTSCV